MSSNYSLMGSAEIIEEFAQWAPADGIRVGRAQPASTLIDPVDAPFGPESIMPVLSAVTVICASTKAVVDLVDKVFSLIEKRREASARKQKASEPSADIVIIDPVSGKEVVRIKPTTQKQEVVKQLTGG